MKNTLPQLDSEYSGGFNDRQNGDNMIQPDPVDISYRYKVGEYIDEKVIDDETIDWNNVDVRLPEEMRSGIYFHEGHLKGTPREPGDYNFNVICSNKHRYNIEIVISRPLAINDEPIEIAAGFRFEEDIRVSGEYNGNRKWKVISSDLPKSIEFDISRGKIFGVSTRGDKYKVELAMVSDDESTIYLSEAVEIQIIANSGICTGDFVECAGEQCVDLEQDPFHHGECFKITPDLLKDDGTRVDQLNREELLFGEYEQPWSWYRFYYNWNETKTEIEVGSEIVASSGGDNGLEIPEIEKFTISATFPDNNEGDMIIAPEIVVVCDGSSVVATYRGSVYRRIQKTGKWWFDIEDGEFMVPEGIHLYLRRSRAFEKLNKLWNELCNTNVKEQRRKWR
jgi:hypothetical protein